jgi:glycosyltransferase involved in cell wall biosynthesis
MGAVLFIHNNFPGQFTELARTLMARGVRCGAITQAQPGQPDIPGLPVIKYNLTRGTTPGIFPLAVRAEADLLRGTRAMEAARLAKQQGFEPDVIIGHTGWGETLLISEVWPRAKQVLYPEFFYSGHGRDIGFDTEFKPLTEEAVLLGKAKNATMSLAMTDADAIVCPTKWQAATLPKVFQPLVRVIHEGVDLAAIKPGPAEPFPLDDGRVIPPGTPVVTHINNNMEPLRGLHIFARALPRLLAEVPEAQVVIIGNHGCKTGYAGAAPDDKTWTEVCFEGLPIDRSRVHFLGKVPHSRMLAALRLSTAHVYYTYPFVLSWSLSEAMASGCYVIASDTQPLHEVIEDGVNGRLLPFFDPAALGDALVAACQDPKAQDRMRRAARRTAERLFDRDESRREWLQLLVEVGLEIPDPAA